MPYETLRDLQPIVLIAKSASCLCAIRVSPGKGVKDFIPFAKARRPRELRTPGVGTVWSTSRRALRNRRGVKLNHVPDKGPRKHRGLMAGNIEIAINQFAIAAHSSGSARSAVLA